MGSNQRRPASVKRRSRRNEIGAVQKVFIAIGSVVIIAAIGGVLAYNAFFSQRVAINKETGCPVDGPVSRAVVLIDQTDTFSAVQAVDIRNQLDAYKATVPRYGELVMYGFAATEKGLPIPIARVCNPGSEGEIDKLVESSVRARRDWTRLFDEPFRGVVSQVLEPKESQTSPIIETIQAVAVQEFGPSEMSNVQKKLIVVSDFLQHTPSMSHYGQLPDPTTVLSSDFFRKLRVDLRDVSLDLLYLHRLTKRGRQGSEHLAFWKALLEAQGATIDRIYSVSG
jgi:hypothetical protein